MRKQELLKEQLAFLKAYDPNNSQIPEMEKSLSYSKRGRSSKNKGASYERRIVKFFEAKFPSLKFGRTPSSGGYKKEIENSNLRGDIVCLSEGVNFLLHLELKNRKAGWKVVQDWYKQAQEDCAKGKYPCVIMHQSLEKGSPAKDFILLELSDFFDIIDYKKVIN